jgi:TP901 family phage tail tape measure protein
MAGFLPPVIAELYAEGTQFFAEMDKAIVKVEELGAASKKSSGVMGSLMGGPMVAAAAITVGALFEGVKSALEYKHSLEEIQHQSNASAAEVERLGSKILQVSNETGTSNKEIASAYLEAEKAGLRKSAADNLVTASAQAAWITGGKVVDITKTLIAAQTLQIAKGMSTAEVTDLLVNANKAHLGSIDTLTTALQGRVGAALASHNIGLQESLVITDQLSKAGFSNSRAMVSFANAIGKAEAPTKTQLAAMQALHINSGLLGTMLTKPNGIIQAVQYLGQVSKTTGESAGSLATAVFGAGASGGATILINNAKNLANAYAQLKGSGADLNKQMSEVKGTAAFQIKELMTQLKNAMTQLGLVALPVVLKAVNMLTSALGSIERFFKGTTGSAIIQTITGHGTGGRAGGAKAFGEEMWNQFTGVASGTPKALFDMFSGNPLGAFKDLSQTQGPSWAKFNNSGANKAPSKRLIVNNKATVRAGH